RTGPHNRILSNHGSIHHNGPHADQHTILYRATVEYRRMADGHLIADDQRMGIVGDMEYTEVLHVRPLSDPDKVHVPANDGMEPNTAVFTQHDIADDHAGLLDKTRRGNCGFDSLKCADHVAHCRGIGPRPARGVNGGGCGPADRRRVAAMDHRLQQKPSWVLW